MALSVVINYVAWWLILFEFAGVLMMKLPRYHIMFGHVCLALAWSTTASITTTLASTITTLAIAAQRIIYFFSRSTTMATTTLTKSLHAPKPSHAKPERLWRWSQLKLWFHHLTQCWLHDYHPRDDDHNCHDAPSMQHSSPSNQFCRLYYRPRDKG